MLSTSFWLIWDANKQALKRQWDQKITITAANFFMVQIFIEGLQPDIKNEMIKTSWHPEPKRLTVQKYLKSMLNKKH
jgi:hypothetical protein